MMDPVAPEFRITRDLDAPRDLVFKVWTEADHLARWWGPAGMDIHVEKLDLQPGGIFHYRLSIPDGGEMWGKFTYREIVPPERIVYTSAFSDAEGNTTRAPFSDSFPLEILNTLIFVDNGATTTVELRGVPVDPTDAEREMFESMFDSMDQGFGGTFRQLDAYLAELQHGM